VKRCPQCNRIESDEALKFCRVDGTTLVSDSGSVSGDAGTAKLGSHSDTSEVHTSQHGRFLCGNGEKDRGFAALNEAVDKADQSFGFMNVNPFIKPLHDDPRFAGLATRRLSELI